MHFKRSKIKIKKRTFLATSDFSEKAPLDGINFLEQRSGSERATTTKANEDMGQPDAQAPTHKRVIASAATTPTQPMPEVRAIPIHKPKLT